MDLEQLRELCLSRPGVTEGIKWGDHICFMVGEKMFCVTSEKGGASFKVTPDEFEELIEREGISPTAYMARHKWISVEGFDVLKKQEWEKYILASYGMVLSKLPGKVIRQFGSPK